MSASTSASQTPLEDAIREKASPRSWNGRSAKHSWVQSTRLTAESIIGHQRTVTDYPHNPKRLQTPRSPCADAGKYIYRNPFQNTLTEFDPINLTAYSLSIYNLQCNDSFIGIRIKEPTCQA
ncbi:hypothetical protein FQN49_006438 [Arthroderma sp. PD_2]|nr:hypothetical protein FQN49_006438 [Arthroderma sp. PD_2]